MIVHYRYFCHWLAKFISGLKKTPAQDIFFENDFPSLLTEEVSQDAQDGFCNNESH